jgi:hypothetical protein
VRHHNIWYSNAEKPRLFHGYPVHDEKLYVWCAVSARRIIGPMSYDDANNVARSVKSTEHPFFDQQKKKGYTVL